MKDEEKQNPEDNISKDKDLSEDKPEIYAIKKIENGTPFSRKDFLKSAVAIGAGLFVASSCSSLLNTERRTNNNMVVRKMKAVNKTFTLPCGTPIPPGATCICDCVASSRTYPGTEMVCTCDTITISAGTRLEDNWSCVCNTVQTCTCDKVCTCHGVCSCNNHATYYTTYYTYWHPN
jgi:hypothetical protein